MEKTTAPMKARNPKLFKELKHALEEEIAVYLKYLQCLEEERTLLRTLNKIEKVDQMNDLSAKRQALIEIMQICEEKRRLILKDFAANERQRLSEIVKENFHQNEAKELQVPIAKLRKLVEKTRRGSFEFGQLLSFSSGMVNGLLSILSNASRSIVTAYNSAGTIKESSHPTTSRKQGVIKEA